MTDELDLRDFLQPLIAHWLPILGLGFVAAAVVVVLKLLGARVFEAEALVSVAPSRYTLRLESAGGVSVPVITKAYPELALASDVVDEVFQQFRGRLPETTDTLTKFARRLAAAPASDPSLLRLTVRDENAQLAADIANAWADVLTARAGQLFGQDQANLQDYQQQLVLAKAELVEADNALAAFQSSNQVGILQAELHSQQAVLADALNREHQTVLLEGDTQDLMARLGALSPTAPARLAEDLALLSIMSHIYGGQMETGQAQTAPAAAALQPLSVQIQIGPDQPLVGPTVADQSVLARDLLSTLQARRDGIEAEVQALRTNILDLQGQLAQAQVSEAELVRAQTLAADQYQGLARKIQEAQIAAGEASNIVQVASRAAVPTEPTGRALLLTSAVAGMLAVLVASSVVLVIDYWRNGPPQSNRSLARAAAVD